jgi:prephenate dehydrogenase
MARTLLKRAGPPGGEKLDRIAFVGMGPTGAAAGMALKNAKLSGVEIIGTSNDRDALSTALSKGAIDRVQRSLRSAVSDAQVVFVDAPLHETHELLETVGPILPDGCVVTDTGTSKRLVQDWAERYLPESVSFVASRPLLKNPPRTIEEADPSVLDGANYCVISGGSTRQDAVRTIVRLIERMGAKPLFLDAEEHDSYAAAMAHLPMVLSAAYVTATAGDDSWRDIHRLAAGEFADMSRPVSNDPQDNESICLSNPEALVHWLDQLIAELYSFRNQISDSDKIGDDLLDKFIKAWEARAKWETGTVVTETTTELPSAGENIAAFFVGRRLTDRMRQLTGDSDDKKGTRYRRRT